MWAQPGECLIDIHRKDGYFLISLFLNDCCNAESLPSLGNLFRDDPQRVIYNNFLQFHFENNQKTLHLFKKLNDQFLSYLLILLWILLFTSRNLKELQTLCSILSWHHFQWTMVKLCLLEIFICLFRSWPILQQWQNLHFWFFQF